MGKRIEEEGTTEEKVDYSQALRDSADKISERNQRDHDVYQKQRQHGRREERSN